MPKSRVSGAADLRAYLESLPDVAAREAFAARCGTTHGFMKLVAGGFRRAGESLAINIDRESGGKVGCEALRPDVDFGYLRGTAKRRDRASARVAR